MNQKPRNIDEIHWSKLPHPHTVGRNKFKYTDLFLDEEGWVDPKKYLPREYDLVLLKLTSHEIYGWWDGKKWDGFYHKPFYEVFYWKKIKNSVYE